jgi:hypothetical protein
MRTRSACLAPGDSVSLAWNHIATLEVWSEQARRGWSPPPVEDNPWMVEFLFRTSPPSHQVIDKHVLRVQIQPFTAHDVLLDPKPDDQWISSSLVAAITREYPGLDYPLPGRAAEAN